MGKHKKESSRRSRQSAAPSPSQATPTTTSTKTPRGAKGENFYRNPRTLKRLRMYDSASQTQRDRSGRITKPAPYQSREGAAPGSAARVEPHRKWFGNTRVIAQESLSAFREAVAQRQADPYSFLMRSNKLPMGLVAEKDGGGAGGAREAKVRVQTAPFGETFGPKAKRKRVSLGVGGVEEMAGRSEGMLEDYRGKLEQTRLVSSGGGVGDNGGTGVGEEENLGDQRGLDDNTGEIATPRDPIFSKGQSRRIWNEAYKVIDSSDVIIQVLDARDPEGTRCRHLERFLKEEAPHKHMIFLLNKCDLVPSKVAATWVRHLTPQHPTLAFHASLTNPFGKGTLISLLRQFSALHAHRAQLSVGLLGYPNTGKSSIVNTLRRKAVCKTAPIPGETKVWQYVTLMRRIFLIDAPGVVPPSDRDTPEELLLRGAVRVENVEEPEGYVGAMLARCERRHVERTYGIKGWVGGAGEAGGTEQGGRADSSRGGGPIDETPFLEGLARKTGKLRKGGEPDVGTVAKMVLNDFIRGKLPWFVPPPGFEEARERRTVDGDGAEGPGGDGGGDGGGGGRRDDSGEAAGDHDGKGERKGNGVPQPTKFPTSNPRSKKRKRLEEPEDEDEDDIAESPVASDSDVCGDADSSDSFGFTSEEGEEEVEDGDEKEGYSLKRLKKHQYQEGPSQKG